MIKLFLKHLWVCLLKFLFFSVHFILLGVLFLHDGYREPKQGCVLALTLMLSFPDKI